MPPKASASKGEKLPVAAFLKLLTSQVGLTTQDAMACATPLIKNGYKVVQPGSNPLAGLSEVTCVSIGITDPDVRKSLVAYGRSGKGKSTVTDLGTGYAGKKRKMTKDSDLDSPLPTKAQEKEAISLDFKEETEDYLLQDRSIVVNRAPVMLAWSVVVAERLGFTREEALSLAHTYTNMNATAKGVSLGIYSPEKGKERITVGPSQPYVNLLGREIPVLSLETGEWRGIAGGAIAEPEQAFGYIQRSFRQNMSAAIGALKLLAESMQPDELNKIGYQLYAEFRPDVTGWGEKAHLSLAKILDLRRGPDGKIIKKEEGQAGEPEANEADSAGQDADSVKKEEADASTPTDASPAKKIKLEKPSEDLFDDDGGISDSDLVGLA